VFTDKSALCGVSLWAQLLELKNGDTYNGTLVNCDSYMNMNLKGVICTSRVRSASIFGKGCHVTRVVLHTDNTAAWQDGSKFWKIEECYVRGMTIKYCRIPNQVRY